MPHVVGIAAANPGITSGQGQEERIHRSLKGRLWQTLGPQTEGQGGGCLAFREPIHFIVQENVREVYVAPTGIYKVTHTNAKSIIVIAADGDDGQDWIG